MQNVASYRQMGFRNGKPLYRVTDSEGNILRNRDEQAIDGGGYTKEWIGRTQADTINEYYAERNKQTEDA